MDAAAVPAETAGTARTGIAGLPAEIRAAYEIAEIGLTWYAWRCNGTATAPLRASTEEALAEAVLEDWRRRRPPVPHQRGAS